MKIIDFIGTLSIIIFIGMIIYFHCSDKARDEQAERENKEYLDSEERKRWTRNIKSGIH